MGSLKLDWGKICFQGPVAFSRISFLAGCWTEGFSLLPAAVWYQPRSLSPECLCKAAHNTAGGFAKAAKEESTPARRKLQAGVTSLGGVAAFTAFYWLEVSHGFCPHTRGGIAQRCEYLGARLMGPFKVCPPQGSASSCKSLERTHFRLAGQIVSVRIIHLCPCSAKSTIDRT